MTYKATLKVHFDTQWDFIGGMYDDETLPEEHYTFEIPVHDINSIQLFRFFGNVARCMGHNEIGIMKGACSLAFNDMLSVEDMRKVADEYDLKLSEDYISEICKLEKEVADLKKKLAENESKNIVEENQNEWQGWGGYVPGSDESVARGCKCPVLDNQEMPDDKKWVNEDCPIHGKKVKSKVKEMNKSPLKWDNDYKFIPAPPES